MLLATREELADEAIRARNVRHLVDFATSLIMQSSLTRREAESLVLAVRERILGLFPQGEVTYELIYARQFSRLIDEFTQPNPGPAGVVLPFQDPRN